MNSNERNCDKCVYGRRSGNCTAWNCKGTVTVEDIKAEARQSAIEDSFNALLLMIKNGYDYPNAEFEEMFIALVEDAIDSVKENINGKTRFNG